MKYQQVELAVAFAIHEDLDIMVSCPEVAEMDVTKIEKYVEKYILRLQEEVTTSIAAFGKSFLQKNDAEGLRKLLMARGIKCPPNELLKLCNGIIRNSKIESRLLFYFPNKDKLVCSGKNAKGVPSEVYNMGSLWYVRMEIPVSLLL